MRGAKELSIAIAVLLGATLAMFGDVLVAGERRLLSQDGELSIPTHDSSVAYDVVFARSVRAQ